MCTWTVSAVGPVVPVVLHRILMRAGGTAGWDRRDRRAQGDAARADRQIFHVVPPVPPIGPTRSLQNYPQYHRYHHGSTAVLSQG